MSLESLCKSCKCGICCFFNKTTPSGFVKDYARLEIGVEYNKKIVQEDFTNEGPLEKDVTKFINEHLDMLVRVKNKYYPLLNKDVELITKTGNLLNPCSFLNVIINDDIVTNMSCKIYDTNFRPLLCVKHDCNEARLVDGQISPCFDAFSEGLSYIKINGKNYSLNTSVLNYSSKWT